MFFRLIKNIDGMRRAFQQITSNGITSNGITSNGITSNGITSNGSTSNGITSNGSTSNGITSNGITSKVSSNYDHLSVCGHLPPRPIATISADQGNQSILT